jgi:monoamine oxidase
MTKNRSILTRRELLRGIIALGGAGAAYTAMHAMGLFGPTSALARGPSTTEALPAGGMAGKRIVVIGAGIAGLCAGMRLARAGADVEILEATGHVGGRSLTLRNGDSYSEWDWDTPTTMRFEQVGAVAPDNPDNYFNAGPGRIPQHHARLIDYCKELGVELQPFLFQNSANLLQNDAWNDGKPVRVRRLKNDLRGHLAELLAKVPNQGALDLLVSPSEVDSFLGMLQQFGQLSAEGAELFYRGGATTTDYLRSGYTTEPGDVHTPGRAASTLSLDDVLKSDFWNSDMFDNLEYFWQGTLMEPVDGMDMIVKGFQRAVVPGGKSVDDLISTGDPVTRIDMDGDTITVTGARKREQIDYVVATLTPHLLARLGGNFIDPTVRQILSSVDVTPACKVGLQGRSRFWEDDDRIYGGISGTKDIIRRIWYPNYSFNSPTGVLTAAYNNGADALEFQALSRKERVDAALAGGEKLHPGYGDKVFADNAVTIAWAKMPYQSGGWAHDTFIEQPKIFEEMSYADPVGRGVYAAGDWYSYWPGWQIGALDSAHMATDQIYRKALNRG